MVLSDRSIREAIEAGRIVIDPLGTDCIQPSSVDLHVDQYFRLFRNHTSKVIDVREDQEDLTELVDVGPEGPADPAPRRVHAGCDDRARGGPRGPRRAPRGEELARAARSAHPLDRGLRRRRLGRAPHPGALERREPSDHPVSGDEDRPDQLLPDDDAGRPPLRHERAQLEVPRAARADPEPLRGELPPPHLDRDGDAAHLWASASRSPASSIAGRRFWWLRRLLGTGAPAPGRWRGFRTTRRGRAGRGRRPAQAASRGPCRASRTSSPCGASRSCSLTIIEAYGALFSRSFHIPAHRHRRVASGSSRTSSPSRCSSASASSR